MLVQRQSHRCVTLLPSCVGAFSCWEGPKTLNASFLFCTGAVVLSNPSGYRGCDPGVVVMLRCLSKELGVVICHFVGADE